LQHGFFRIFFLDESYGWGLCTEWVGENGRPEYSLSRTIDGGQSWNDFGKFEKTEYRSPLMIERFVFNDRNNGWFVGHESGGIGVVFRTIDGGKTIRRLEAKSLKFSSLMDIFPLEQATLWLVGSEVVLKSPDGGLTWHQGIKPDLSERLHGTHFNKLWFNKMGRGCVFGERAGAIILCTSDWGARWQVSVETEDAVSFTDASFWNSSNGCAVGASTLLYCTTDAGKSWTSRDVLPPSKGPTPFMRNHYKQIYFYSKGRVGFALDIGGYLYRSVDHGNSWNEVNQSLARFKGKNSSRR
jgi:photosystem II stability/assembly factor-like uncharacterized protein